VLTRLLRNGSTSAVTSSREGGRFFKMVLELQFVAHWIGLDLTKTNIFYFIWLCFIVFEIRAKIYLKKHPFFGRF